MEPEVAITSLLRGLLNDPANVSSKFY